MFDIPDNVKNYLDDFKKNNPTFSAHSYTALYKKKKREQDAYLPYW